MGSVLIRRRCLDFVYRSPGCLLLAFGVFAAATASHPALSTAARSSAVFRSSIVSVVASSCSSIARLCAQLASVRSPRFRRSFRAALHASRQDTEPTATEQRASWAPCSRMASSLGVNCPSAIDRSDMPSVVRADSFLMIFVLRSIGSCLSFIVRRRDREYSPVF